MGDEMRDILADSATTPEQADMVKSARRGNRLSMVLAVGAVLGAMAFGTGAYLLTQQVNQNTRDTGQDVRITRIENNPPACTVLQRAPSPDPKIEEACRDYLRNLARQDVFPHSLSCFIAEDAGVANAKKCGLHRHRSSRRAAAADAAMAAADTVLQQQSSAPSPPATSAPSGGADTPAAPGTPGGGGAGGGGGGGSQGGGSGDGQGESQTGIGVQVHQPPLPDIGVHIPPLPTPSVP